MHTVGIFNVRVVMRGEHYGLRDCLTHDDATPLIEFYDSRYTGEGFGPRGQFVSRYYLPTLAYTVCKGQGVLLDTGSPDWRISAADLRDAMAYAVRLPGVY